jgi:hypothetical protein
VFESSSEVLESFDEVRRRGVWWELGRRLELLRDREIVVTPRLGGEALGTFAALLPAHERIAGQGAG